MRGHLPEPWTASRVAVRLRRAALAWTVSALAGLGLVAQAPKAAPAPPEALHVATFDSGFGGYLTAKSIEGTAPQLLAEYDATLSIRHYGDTKNLPYGEKTPAQIAELGSAGVLKAFAQGADMVFIACNTASTQCQRIREAVRAAYPGQDKPVVSIIDASAAEARRLLDEVLAHRPSAVLTILATPATVRSMVYPRQLAALYGVPLQETPPKVFRQPRWYATKGATLDSLTQESLLQLGDGRRIRVLQLAPANWVELIEHGGDAQARLTAVRRDVGLLQPLLASGEAPDVVGYFCTHFPILDVAIRTEMAAQLHAQGARYIAQGQLMAQLFRQMAEARLKGHRRATPLGAEQLQVLVAAARADITISGPNGATTRELARTMFPDDPAPVVREEDMGSLAPAPPK